MACRVQLGLHSPVHTIFLTLCPVWRKELSSILPVLNIFLFFTSFNFCTFLFSSLFLHFSSSFFIFPFSVNFFIFLIIFVLCFFLFIFPPLFTIFFKRQTQHPNCLAEEEELTILRFGRGAGRGAALTRTGALHSKIHAQHKLATGRPANTTSPPCGNVLLPSFESSAASNSNRRSIHFASSFRVAQNPDRGPSLYSKSNRVVSSRDVNLPQCVFVPVFSVTHTSCITSLQSNQKSCCYQSRRFSFVEHHHIDFVPVFFGPPLLQSIITNPRKVSSPPVVFELTRLVVPVRGPLTGKSFELVLVVFFVAKRVVSVRGRLIAGSFEHVVSVRGPVNCGVFELILVVMASCPARRTCRQHHTRTISKLHHRPKLSESSQRSTRYRRRRP